MTNQIFAFEELETADLIVDAVYEGGPKGNIADDPLANPSLEGFKLVTNYSLKSSW